MKKVTNCSMGWLRSQSPEKKSRQKNGFLLLVKIGRALVRRRKPTFSIFFGYAAVFDRSDENENS
jgi:hypothetical protein